MMIESSLLAVLTNADRDDYFSLEDYGDRIRVDLENLFSVRLLRAAHQNQYGLHSITGLGLGTAMGRLEFCEHVQAQIKLFEPRLKNVRVSLGENISTQDRVLRLTILADLSVLKAAFESSVELSAHRIRVGECA